MKKRSAKKAPPKKKPAASAPAAPAEAASWVHHEELRRWEKNPRVNEAAVPRVMASIREFGFVAPIVVWASKGRLVAGDTRLKAMRRILAEEPGFVARGAPGPGLVRVVRHEFRSEEEANKYAVADNRLNELARWDPILLGELLPAYTPEDHRLMGFEPEEVARYLPTEPEPPAEFQSFDLNIETEHKCPKCGYEWSGKTSKSGQGEPARSRRIASPS